MFHRRMSSLPDRCWPAATLALVVVSLGACGSSAKQAQATTPATSRAASHEVRLTAQPAAPAQQVCALEPVYFAYDSSALDERARDALARNASCLRNQKRDRMRVVGMTDERGTEEYNAALGDRRARVAVQYLASLGIEEQRMLPHSMGEELATGRDEQGWAHDRRAQFEGD